MVVSPVAHWLKNACKRPVAVSRWVREYLHFLLPGIGAMKSIWQSHVGQIDLCIYPISMYLSRLSSGRGLTCLDSVKNIGIFHRNTSSLNYFPACAGSLVTRLYMDPVDSFQGCLMGNGQCFGKGVCFPISRGT